MDTIFLHRDLTAGDLKNERGEVTGPNYVGHYEGKTTESAVEFNYDKTLIVGCVDSETITNQSQAVVLAFQEFQSLISEAELPPMPGTKLNFSCVFSATVVNERAVAEKELDEKPKGGKGGKGGKAVLTDEAIAAGINPDTADAATEIPSEDPAPEDPKE